MTLIVGAHGGASSNGRNPMDPPSESSWWCPNVRTQFHEGIVVVPQGQDVIP